MRSKVPTNKRAGHRSISPSLLHLHAGWLGAEGGLCGSWLLPYWKHQEHGSHVQREAGPPRPSSGTGLAQDSRAAVQDGWSILLIGVIPSLQPLACSPSSGLTTTRLSPFTPNEQRDFCRCKFHRQVGVLPCLPIPEFRARRITQGSPLAHIGCSPPCFERRGARPCAESKPSYRARPGLGDPSPT